MECDKKCWTDCIELSLKVIFVAVFTWGVMNAVCCMKSCSAKSGCCKSGIVQTAKQCGPTCVKACCAK